MLTKKLLFGVVAVVLISLLAISCAGPTPAPTPPAPPPAGELVVKDAAEARQAAIAYIQARAGADAPDSDINWQESDETPPGLVGTANIYYTSDYWTVSVSYPVVRPDLTVYQVVLLSPNLGWRWTGEVKADGTVTETSPFQKITQEASQSVALDFVKQSPTFVFDGIEGSLQMTEAVTLRCPYCWQFVFEFDSAHAGYGDRTGQMLAEVITHHRAVISVDHLRVVGAIMDTRWDMLTQQMLPFSEETAREFAEDYVKNSPTFVYDGIESSLELVETLYPDIENAWQFVFRFESRHAGYGDRTGQMLAQVITPHQAIITVENGQVTVAVMDKQWDMLLQQMIGEAPPPPPMGVPAAPNDSIVTARVIDMISVSGDFPWEIVIEIQASEDVPGLNNATRSRIGEMITVRTGEDVSDLEKGQTITARVRLEGDERTRFFIAEEIQLSQ
jgi:hypothetical protein